MANPSIVRSNRSGAISAWLMLVALVASACGGGASSEQDWAAQALDQMEADGIRPEIAECVVTVGRRELARGPLSDAAADELLTNCAAAQLVIDGADPEESPDAELAMTDLPLAFGDDDALDELWVSCEAGDGAACDDLFDRSPIGSEYEDFGVSCGNRPELLKCSELALLPEEAGAEAP